MFIDVDKHLSGLIIVRSIATAYSTDIRQLSPDSCRAV